MKRFEEAISVSDANEKIKAARKDGDDLKDWHISVPQEGVTSIILVFETIPSEDEVEA